MPEIMNKEIEYIRRDLENMNVKLDQVMSFMALMQGAAVQDRQNKLDERVDKIESWRDKFVGVYVFIGGLITVVSFIISIIAFFKR